MNQVDRDTASSSIPNATEESNLHREGRGGGGAAGARFSTVDNDSSLGLQSEDSSHKTSLSLQRRGLHSALQSRAEPSTARMVKTGEVKVWVQPRLHSKARTMQQNTRSR